MPSDISKTSKHFADISQAAALKFVVLIGIVSLFADMTYEGARSITGPYLAVLGANAVIVGFVIGFGALLGYGLRLVFGYLADRTAKYWTITLIGYVCNLLAVPLLALTSHWATAASLIIMERVGKAIRTPARDAMLSHACQRMGLGWGFGLHEAFDQTGAMLGPLLVAVIFYFKGSYHESFAILAIPALLALITLILARWLYPNPQALEIPKAELEVKSIHSKVYWFYVMGAALIAVGFADFPLIAYHFAKASVFPSIWIPVIYAIAMGLSGLTALLCGYFYDRYGFVVLIFVTAFSCWFAFFTFGNNIKLISIGIILWSVGMGAHDSLMRAVIANLIPINKRGSAYGIFNAVYGISLFLGNVIIGALYDVSIASLIVYSIFAQLVAIPFLWTVMKNL
ncbi:MAG: MFS transporter [Gammaproteobacteria bacterium]